MLSSKRLRFMGCCERIMAYLARKSHSRSKRTLYSGGKRLRYGNTTNSCSIASRRPMYVQMKSGLRLLEESGASSFAEKNM
jgi:hypothetical protein